MPDDIAGLLAFQGFVTRPQLLDLRYTDRSIQALRRQKLLLRIGPGLYAGAPYHLLTVEEQHRIRCRAVATRFVGKVAFTHQSAAIIHGIDVWGLPLEHLHITRLDTGRGRHQAGVAHHVAELPDSELTEIDGLLVATPARCVWEIAVRSTREPALVVADSALHRGLVDEDELERLSRKYTVWRGAGKAKVTLSLADGRAESPGETRARHLFHETGLPRPVPQFKVYGIDGRLLAIVDFAWPEFRHLTEFDGLKKYGVGTDLAKEKAREDSLRSLSWGMTRLIWAQLSPGSRRAVAEELAQAMKRSARLYGPLAS